MMQAEENIFQLWSSLEIPVKNNFLSLENGIMTGPM